MSQQSLAVMFADISGSTQLYVDLGDERAREIVAQCIHLMTEAARRRGGAPIRTIGDEVLTAFSSITTAIDAAIEMQQQITGAIVVEGRPLAIRIGFHFGAVLLEETDVYGDAVNLAARVAVYAKPGQILTTGQTIEAMTETEKALCRQIDIARFKGKWQPVSVFELLWRADGDTTLMLAPWATKMRPAGKLMLAQGNQWHELSEAHPSLTIGRAEENDLVVPLLVVSRLHARLEHRNGRFVLSDMSANGTFVVGPNGAVSFLRRESLELTGSGTLGLGDPDGAHIAYYVDLQS